MAAFQYEPVAGHAREDVLDVEAVLMDAELGEIL